ncbi:response regulator transcription factor [Parazoarcus communis]|uniref:response regulator transcription factor n=1 Tax=Parazoarcus communis TaxID=41977 RepID=UPI0019027386|nr:response regulator [Parazoarcus communis]
MTQCLQSAPENARILIVDDHPIVREGMAMFLNQQSNLFVCCMAENAADAMTRTCTHRHDLAIVDMSLNRDSGLDLIASIRHQSADI